MAWAGRRRGTAGRAGRRGGGQRGRQRLPRLRLCAHRWRLPLGDGAGSGRGGRQGRRDSGRHAAAGAPAAAQERSEAARRCGRGSAPAGGRLPGAPPGRGRGRGHGGAGELRARRLSAVLRRCRLAGELGAVRRRRGGDTPPPPPANMERSGAGLLLPPALRGPLPAEASGAARGPPAPMSAPRSGACSKLSTKRN